MLNVVLNLIESSFLSCKKYRDRDTRSNDMSRRLITEGGCSPYEVPLQPRLVYADVHAHPFVRHEVTPSSLIRFYMYAAFIFPHSYV